MSQIDGYSDLVRIGHGGLGDVYRATRVSTGGTVAIKVLRDVSDESVAWHRTRRELTALVSLAGHAHVVQLLELIELTSGPALVMEYAPGGSVAALLARREGVLTVSEAVLIGRHTAAALVAAHGQDIVHRDLKPQNLLIDAYGQVKLCDFGIASLARSEEFRTRTSALSMRYASPEDLDDDADVGPSSDIYSLGATLVHLVHGAPPTLKERLQPWTPPDSDAELDAIDAVIERCLQPEPAARPTATEVLDELEAIDWDLPDRCRALPVEEAAPPAPPRDARASASVMRSEPEPRAAPSAVGFGVAPAAERGRIVAETSSATIVRRDGVPPGPLPSRPSAGAPLRRWPWVAGAVGVAAVIGVGLALFWPSDRDGDDDLDIAGEVDTIETATPEAIDTELLTGPVVIVERPGLLGLLDDATVVWPFGDVGECLAQVDTHDELAVVDCDEPHDLQRFAVADLDEVDVATDFPADAEFPADAVRVATDDACRDAFVEFVGVGEADSVFLIAITRPSAGSWAEGDRRFQCLLGVRGHRLLGNAAASGQ